MKEKWTVRYVKERLSKLDKTLSDRTDADRHRDAEEDWEQLKDDFIYELSDKIELYTPEEIKEMASFIWIGTTKSESATRKMKRFAVAIILHDTDEIKHFDLNGRNSSAAIKEALLYACYSEEAKASQRLWNKELPDDLDSLIDELLNDMIVSVIEIK